MTVVIPETGIARAQNWKQRVHESMPPPRSHSSFDPNKRKLSVFCSAVGTSSVHVCFEVYASVACGNVVNVERYRNFVLQKKRYLNYYYI